MITFKIVFSQINPTEHENDLMEFVKKFGESEYCSQKKSAINIISQLYKYVSNDNKKCLVE